MAGVGPIEVLLFLGVLPVLLVGLVVGVVLVASRAPEISLTSEVASARRHASTTAVLSTLALVALPVVVVFLVAGLIVLGFTGLPFGLAVTAVDCLPLIGALAALLVLLIGELTWPRPTGTSRTAVLHDRSARMVLGGAWPRTTVVVSALAVAGLVAGGVVGDESGGSVTHQWSGRASTASPFPGWTYAGPQLVALGLCLVLAALAGRATVRRSAVVTADPDTDLLLRRASLARVCRVLVAGGLVTLGADLFVGAAAITHVYAEGTAHQVGAVLMLLGPVLLVAGLICLLVPVPRPAGPVGRPAEPMSTLSA